MIWKTNVLLVSQRESIRSLECLFLPQIIKVTQELWWSVSLEPRYEELAIFSCHACSPCVGLAWDMCNVLIPRVLHLIISVAVQIPKRQDRNWVSVIIIWHFPIADPSKNFQRILTKIQFVTKFISLKVQRIHKNLRWRTCEDSV